MELKISAKVEGPEFYYAESHEWKYMSELAVEWFNKAMTEMFEMASKEAARGEGSLTATLTSQWNNDPVLTQVIPNLSYKDMVKVQRKFVNKYDEIVKIAEGKKK